MKATVEITMRQIIILILMLVIAVIIILLASTYGVNVKNWHQNLTNISF